MRASKYEILLKAVEIGSLTKAAALFGYTQSGMSQLLSSIENDFGFQIVSRSRSGISWNSIGESLIPYIEAICEHERILRQKVDDISSREDGIVRIGTVLSFALQVLNPFMKQFTQEHPQIQLVRRIMGESHEEMEQWLRRGEIDIGFLVGPSTDPLRVITTIKDEIFVAISKENPLALKSSITVDELMRQPFISNADAFKDCYYVEGFEEIKKNPAYVTKEDMAALSLVENNTGVTLISQLSAGPLFSNVVFRPLQPKAYRRILVTAQPENLLAPPAKLFISSLLEYLAEKQ